MSWLNRLVMGGIVRLLPGGTVSDVSTTPATAGVTLLRDGGISGQGPTVNISGQRWDRSFNPAVGDNYWVRFTRTSGGSIYYVGSTVGVWHNLNTSRNITHDIVSGSDTETATYTIEIASDSSGTNIVSASAAGAYTVTINGLP